MEEMLLWAAKVSTSELQLCVAVFTVHFLEWHPSLFKSQDEAHV
jgi:hypothetical protein